MKGVLIFCLLVFIMQCDVTAQQKNLDYFITQGLQNSPLLKDYSLQIQSNSIDSLRLRASYGRQINATSTGVYAPVIKGWGYDESVTNAHTYTALAGVTQTLVSKNNITNQFLAIKLQSLGLENQGKITEQDLKRGIVQQYITAYGDLLQIRFNEEMLSLLQEEERLLKKMTENGVYKQTDYLSFLVTIQQQQLLVKQISNQYQNNLATLNYITGQTDTAYAVLDAPAVALDLLPEMKQTVFYHQFEIDSMKIVANDKQIDYSYKPKVNWFADAGYNSSFLTTPYKNFGWSAGVSVTVPIYDGKQRKMQHQKNVIAEQGRKNNQDYFSSQYHQQVAQLQQQLQLTEALLEQTNAQIKYSEGLIKAQQQQLVTGDVRITDYIIAISNYLNAKNIISQNTINKLQIISQINYWNRKL